MASNSMHFTLTIFSSFLITLHFSSPSTASSQRAICDPTPFPSFCESQSPTNYNHSATVCDYGRFFIRRSLETTQNFISLVNAYLGNPYALSKTDIRALEDCGSLLDLNVDFLSATVQNTDSTDYLQSSQAEDMHTLLSAVLTNHQTCSDGIHSSASPSIQSALLGPFENGTMLFSVSLALYKQAWVTSTSKGRWLTERNPLFSAIGSGRKADDRSHLKIPRRSEGKIREARSMRGRKLLQLGGGYVHVNQIAVVRQDGTGDFSTIGDAVAAAPNGTDAGGGYYVIYVVAGVYQEYVSVGSSQTYVMMIGDGIGQTVITGSRNVADGWTTFNCATFGKLTFS
ncbi:hypothetical protein RHGRI_021438 [Rhododendron griersonianum]|uniref:Pectinesterase inhibitor domain-containing protein n=1 Tax=Rhododendron griersonianum TaxID=479676 RepID=A0AAV6JP58_9ERIC|nr:hypothetical protein RHGRI_021438 [Rhododendron griersonianum]